MTVRVLGWLLRLLPARVQDWLGGLVVDHMFAHQAELQRIARTQEGVEAMRHVRTDPVCLRHRAPRGRLLTWWFNRHRGRLCPLCRASRVLDRIDAQVLAEMRGEEGKP